MSAREAPLECESTTLQQYPSPRRNFKAAGSLFGLGMIAGMVGLVAAEHFGLVGSSVNSGSFAGPDASSAITSFSVIPAGRTGTATNLLASAAPAAVAQNKRVPRIATDVEMLQNPDATRDVEMLAQNKRVPRMPMEPIADLDAAQVTKAVCEGLMQNDENDTGMVRLFNFLTPAGRMLLAPPAREPGGGIVGGVTLEDFLSKAGSPAIGALHHCKSVTLLGQAEVIPGSMTRGAMGQQLIEVSNFGEDGQPDEVSRFNIKLEQQRRPPQEGCWTIQELFVLQKTRWQELLLEGEELDGDDAPGGNVEKDGQ